MARAFQEVLRHRFLQDSAAAEAYLGGEAIATRSGSDGLSSRSVQPEPVSVATRTPAEGSIQNTAITAKMPRLMNGFTNASSVATV